MNAKHLALLLLLFASTANAELVADKAYGVKYSPTELRLNYLPQDQDKQYVTLFGSGTRLTEAKQWFETNAELKRLKDNSHYNAIDTTSVMFRDRYASNTPTLPVFIRIQDSRGRTIQEFSNLPMSAEATIKMMNSCPRRNQDDPPNPLPPDKPATPPQKSFPIWPAFVVAIIAAIVGGILGVKAKWTETHF